MELLKVAKTSKDKDFNVTKKFCEIKPNIHAEIVCSALLAIEKHYPNLNKNDFNSLLIFYLSTLLAEIGIRLENADGMELPEILNYISDIMAVTVLDVKTPNNFTHLNN